MIPIASRLSIIQGRIAMFAFVASMPVTTCMKFTDS